MLLSNTIKRSVPLGRGPLLRSLQSKPIKRVNTRCFTSSSTSSAHSDPSFFKYNVAVAFQPKDKENKNIFLKKLKHAPEKPSPTGDDNYFISERENSFLAVGVADGVGGWSEAGYDSSALSRSLCKYFEIYHQNSKLSLKDLSNLKPIELLSYAYAKSLDDDEAVIGGTTACFGLFDQQGKLKIGNLGDSWVGVFRNFKCVHESKLQTLAFNTPYQLAKIPKELLRQSELDGKSYIMSKPEEADEYEFQLQKNDLIMFATDGVVDNICTQDIEIYLRDEFSNAVVDLNKVASKFVKNVVKLSKDPNYPSVFAQELSTITKQKYLGGKEDDITIVLVQAT